MPGVAADVDPRQTGEGRATGGTNYSRNQERKYATYVETEPD